MSNNNNNGFMGFFGKITEQATDFIQKNPDQVENLKQQAVGFLKTAVDKEAEKGAQNTGKPQSKSDETKAQILGVLKPKLDEVVEGYKTANANANANANSATVPQSGSNKPPPGKPSYLIPKKDDEKDNTETSGNTNTDTDTDTAEKPPEAPAAKPSKPSRPPPGKPSYLIPKKKDDDAEAEGAAGEGNDE
eukprot:jgi/Psemu1/51387/gm1.51387_g